MINPTSSSPGRKVLFIALLGLAPYWFMNATVWIPWIFSRTLGLILMVTMVPILWGVATLFCLKHFAFDDWKRETWRVASIFLLASVVSDIFFFLIWRGLPTSELYHWTSLTSYGMVFVIPFVVWGIVKRSTRLQELKMTTPHDELFTAGFVALFFILTLYCVRFW